MFNVGVEIGLVVGRGQPRARNTLRPQARMQLQRALGTAAKALRRNGLSGFADDVASVVRVAVALAAGPASIVDVRRAAKRLAYRKRAR